jgi:hypothetical protein
VGGSREETSRARYDDDIGRKLIADVGRHDENWAQLVESCNVDVPTPEESGFGRSAHLPTRRRCGAADASS